MSASHNNSSYDCGFDKSIHQRWGKATKDPAFRVGSHGRLELISNPNTQLQRGKANKWESVPRAQLWEKAVAVV